MRLIGFIQEHDDVAEALPFEQCFGNLSLGTNEYLKLIQYLENGCSILSWMGYVEHITTGEPIVPDSYSSDGYFVWPDYFTYYVRELKGFVVEPDLLEHVLRKPLTSERIALDETQSAQLESELSNILNRGTM